MSLLLLSVATHGSTQPDEWVCADCERTVTLDTHGRCGYCHRDNVAPNHRPEKIEAT